MVGHVSVDQPVNYVGKELLRTKVAENDHAPLLSLFVSSWKATEDDEGDHNSNLENDIKGTTDPGVACFNPINNSKNHETSPEDM